MAGSFFMIGTIDSWTAREICPDGNKMHPAPHRNVRRPIPSQLVFLISSSQDATIELRKSCDYCVRLKRACDGKNPCSLCSRRHKPCTRSARKKSGPAKGTKYAPRRKRSAIAAWAERAASAAAGQTGQLHDSPGGGGRTGGYPTPTLSPGEAAAPPALFCSSRGQTRHGGGEREIAGGLVARPGNRVGQRTEFGSPSSPSSPQALPFPAERFVKQEVLSTGRGGGGGGGGGQGRRRLAPRLEPGLNLSPTGHASPMAAGFRRQHATPGAWSAPMMEASTRSGLSRLEEAAGGAGRGAAPSGSEARGGAEGAPSPVSGARSTVPSLPRSAGMELYQGRTRESGGGQPLPREWARSPSDTYMWPVGLVNAKRLRLVSAVLHRY